MYVEHNLSIHKKHVKSFPGVTSTLEKLKANGIKLGLVTSKRRHTAIVGLEIAGIQSIFDAMVFCDDTIKHKPDPAPILKALDILKYSLAATTLNPRASAPASIFRVLMVGTLHQILTQPRTLTGPGSVVVSVQSAGVTYGAYEKDVIEQEKPDYVLDDISQVLTLCGLADKV